MIKSEREAHIVSCAHSLAKMGLTFRQIELRLRIKYSEAVTVLKDPWLRRCLELERQGRSIFDV